MSLSLYTYIYIYIYLHTHTFRSPLPAIVGIFIFAKGRPSCGYPLFSRCSNSIFWRNYVQIPVKFWTQSAAEAGTLPIYLFEINFTPG